MIEGQTNVRSARFGAGALDELGSDLDRFLVTTMEVPWRLAQPRLKVKPAAVLFVESMEQWHEKDLCLAADRGPLNCAARCPWPTTSTLVQRGRPAVRHRARLGPRAPAPAQAPRPVESTGHAANAGDFYARVRGLPYTRPVPLEHMKEIVAVGGGWMIPQDWIGAMPAWLRAPLAGQAAWKWIVLTLLCVLFALPLRLAYRLSKRGNRQRPFLQALAWT